ncbi:MULTISPECIES: hypothetical protein [Bacillales]|uniref:hypothetical protein n=1 Tax=Bacillales TaxID=1385 RepID=UPI0006A7D75F|nr:MULTISPECIES: hypothetical protein [Bacillales]OBZ17051.1 hypothetical protein A7975_03940 [Bacillus sp. FJAT-26390]
MDKKSGSIHETQASKTDTGRNGSFDPLFEDAQRIEGGGPPQKVIWHTLPKGIRVIGYFFAAIVVAMVVFALSTNFF